MSDESGFRNSECLSFQGLAVCSGVLEDTGESDRRCVGVALELPAGCWMLACISYPR